MVKNCHWNNSSVARCSTWVLNILSIFFLAHKCRKWKNRVTFLIDRHKKNTINAQSLGISKLFYSMFKPTATLKTIISNILRYNTTILSFKEYMFRHPWWHPQLKENATTKLFKCNRKRFELSGDGMPADTWLITCINILSQQELTHFVLQLRQ